MEELGGHSYREEQVFSTEYMHVWLYQARHTAADLIGIEFGLFHV